MSHEPCTTAASAAEQLGRTIDDLLFLQSVHPDLLLAIAGGRLDVVALAREELAARGLGKDGRWVGFRDAEATWGNP